MQPPAELFAPPSESGWQDVPPIASVVRPMDRWEGFAFAYLHKTQFLDPLIGRDARDAVAGVSAFGVFLLVLMGFWRYRAAR